jgi:hypothetical protein
MEERKGPFPKREGQRPLGISKRQEERTSLEEGLIMSWPEWAGPFGIPEDYDEVQDFILTSAALYLIGTVGYEIGIRHTMARMAQHHYANPSLRAIRAAAARQTVFPSVMNGASLFARTLGPSVVTASSPIVATAAGAYLGVQVVEESEIIPQTLAISQGNPSKPWWMPLAAYHALYS